MGESLSKPDCLISKSARDTSDRTSCRVTSGCPGKGNLPIHIGVKRGGCARNSQQMSEGAQSRTSIPEGKRAKVMLHSRTLPTESMPRTGTKCHPPNLLKKCDQNQVKDKSSTRQVLDSSENGVPRTERDSPCLEEVEPRRPGLRPRVRQRLSACAMAGNMFCTIAMIVLTVSVCAVSPDIAIPPTAIQLDPVTRAQMLLSADMREWKDAEEKELASMKSNNVFTECNLPSGRKTVKTKWIYKKKLNK